MKPPIKVIHVITRLIIGGAQENTLLTVLGLQRDPSYDAALVTGPALGPEGELTGRARREARDFLVLPEMRREVNPWRDARTLLDLTALFRRRRPHIVHTHSSKAGVLGRIAARAAGAPVIVHTIHGMSFHPYQSRGANFLFRGLERWCAGWTDRIVSVADAMTDQAVAGGIAPREKFVTIYSGMEVEPFLAPDGERDRVRAELGVEPDEIAIGKVARLFELKGHDDVLAAAPRVLARFPRARFVFVGDGILREELKRRAESLGVARRVIFAGLAQPARIPALLKGMDLVVHASLREGLPRVLPQALLSGAPVVAYDSDGAREVVRDGVTGFLAPARSVAGLADAMLRALSDMDAARAMAREGRRFCVERFRAETMVRKLDELYRNLLANKGLFGGARVPGNSVCH